MMKGIVDSADFMGISAGFLENPAYTRFNFVNFRDNPTYFGVNSAKHKTHFIYLEINGTNDLPTSR
jgi:hypothetical protein